jgi:hypothetical protein
MSVANDAIMTGGNGLNGHNQQAGGVTSISSTGITVGGAATFLAACFTFGKSGVSDISALGATWNSGAMFVISSTSVNDGSNTDSAHIAYVLSPSSGANTLAANWTGSADVYMGAASFTGTDTSTGINSDDTVNPTNVSSVAINTTSDGATLAVFSNNNGAPTVNQTLIFVDDPFIPGGGATYAIGGSGTNTHTFTGGTVQSILGIHIIVPSAVSPNGGTYLQEDGASKFTLEDGSGFYLIESWSTSAVANFPPFIYGDLNGIGTPGRFFKERLS